MSFLDAFKIEMNERVNKNPYGVVLVMGQFIQQSQTEFRFEYNPTVGTKDITEYLPAMLNGMDSPKNIPDLDIYEWVFTLTVALSGEDENANPQLDQRKALDWFRKDLVDNPLFTLDVAGVDYNVVTTAYHINLQSVTNTLSGQKRSFVSMQIGVQSGIGVFFGNDISISLKEIGGTYFKLNKLSSAHKKNKVASSGFPLIGNKTENVAIDSSYGYNTIIIYEDNDLINAILSEILTNGKLNKKYMLKIEFSPITTIEKTVLLVGGNIDDNLGQFITIGFDMVDTIDD